MQEGRNKRKDDRRKAGRRLTRRMLESLTSSVVDLLLVDRRQVVLVAVAPNDVVLLVQVGAFVCDRDDLAGVTDFLSADAERITWNPDDTRL